MFTRPTWIWCLALTYREEHCMFVLVMECLRVLFWALCFLLFMFHLSAEQSWRWFWPSGSAELPLVSPVCFSSLLVVCLSLSVCQCRLRLGVADLHSAHLRSIYTITSYLSSAGLSPPDRCETIRGNTKSVFSPSSDRPHGPACPASPAVSSEPPLWWSAAAASFWVPWCLFVSGVGTLGPVLNTGWCNQLYEPCFTQNWLLTHFVVRPQASPESLQMVQSATVGT